MAVATAAVREAQNGMLLIERIRRETGVAVDVIDGEREALYGFLGAVHGVPVQHGVLFDMGGGSMQLSRFRNRTLRKSWSLPLGALRLSGTFLKSDPPGAGEVRRLERHVREVIEETGLKPLQAGERLVGTGGTVRNLAKVDQRRRRYPITRLHGYVLGANRVHEIASNLAARRLRDRERVPGLSDERADSIVGGSLGVQVVMDVLGARELVVSGQGVREGLAYSMLSDELPPAAEVRTASIASLVARFAGWDAASARRRPAIAQALLRAFDESPEAAWREALAHAAAVLDLGRSVDFFDRHEHVAAILLATDLAGFSHRQIARIAAIVHNTGVDDAGVKPYAPLLKRADRELVERLGVVLALADDIEERCRPGEQIELTCARRQDTFVVSVPQLLAWRPRGIAPRFERAFGRELVVEPGAERRSDL
jgi:exopolyphosphatase/guanosine-5'-triphosphate,3'-diphosphate pyrophosphatase